MPKKRKTREQKILAQEKRQAVQETAPSIVSSQKNDRQPTSTQTLMQGATFSLPAITPDNQSNQRKTKQSVTTIAIATEEYSYLGTDLLKTAIVTGAIAITEIIIRFLFRG